VSLFKPPSHIYREEHMGLHDRVATGEALQTDLRKLPGTCWPKLDVGGGAHQSTDHPG